MKKIKMFVLVFLLLIITGCGKDDSLKVYYNNMQIGKDSIKGYILNLRIYGSANKKKVNEIVTISNYNNKQIKIEKVVRKEKEDKTHDIRDNFEFENEFETSYVNDGKYYISDKNGEYKETSNINYKNPSIYLEGVLNLVSKEEIENNTYKLYNVVYKEDIVKDILRDTIIEKMDIKDEIKGKIYIDEYGYIYRIIYEIDDMTINANYYSINNITPISFPRLENNNTDKIY